MNTVRQYCVIWAALLPAAMIAVPASADDAVTAGAIDVTVSGRETAQAIDADGDDDTADSIERVMLALEPDHALSETLSRMRELHDRMARKQTDRRTQELQKQVLKDLDQLIRQAEQQQQSRQRGGQSGGQQQQQQAQGQQQQQRGQQHSAGQQQAVSLPQNRQDGNSRDNQNQGEATPYAEWQRIAQEERAKRQQLVVRQIWGHLPVRLRNRILNLTDDRFLPKYEQLIRSYFRALAERNSTPFEHR